MGKPAPGIQLDIIDHDGNPLPPNQEGDIAVKIKPQRPLGLFKEYWKDPERTAATMKGDWYITGDRAYKDDDGYFWFVGRADDVILSAGYRIGPFEVESALIEHPDVVESAVVASPDEVRGAVVKAFVVLAEGVRGSDELVKTLQDHVKAVTAPYKYPRKIEFIDALPKTISGKIRRIELRDRESESITCIFAGALRASARRPLNVIINREKSYANQELRQWGQHDSTNRSNNRRPF